MSPVMVALIRGLGLTAAFAAVGALITALSDAAYAKYWWAPFVLVALRTIEGVIDKMRGQPDQVPLGSKSS